MKPHPSEEKTKPFRLVKYFTFISLIVIFLGTIILSAMSTRLAREMQFEKNEDFALVLVENVNHQIFTQFIIPFVQKYGKTQLSHPEQFSRMDTIVRNTLHSFKVEMANIYDMQATISYSFDKELIGIKGLGGSAYQKALNGEPTSRLQQRGSFWALLIGSFKESKIVTFAPLRAEYPLFILSGPVLGVIEIIQDVSEDYRVIYRFQIKVLLTITAVMGILLVVLILVVNHGEEIIENRARERMKLKEQLNQAEHLSRLGEMVAAVSHEIRNPLGIIMSSAEHLKGKTASNLALNSIPNIIVEEAGRLNNIITDFLNYARPRAPQFLACQVEEILAKNIKLFTSDLKDDSFKVHQTALNQIPPIMADENMLYQAFLNLLLNAKQAMPEGGKIRIALSSGNNRVKIEFEDEGTGIPKDVREKIWAPFFTTKATGTGLGLGIVKNIVESHHGYITIANRSPKGARVTVEIPIQPEA